MANRDQTPAGNRPPKDGAGLTRKVTETNEKTRQSDGKRSESASRKTKGAGPALAQRSKDARK